jgi:hypothetical protein
MDWFDYAGRVPNAAVAGVVADVRCRSTRAPTQKKARPSMMVHRFGLASRRNRNFKNAHKGVLKNDFVACWSGLYGVEAIREGGFVLAVEIEVSAEHYCRSGQ